MQTMREMVISDEILFHLTCSSEFYNALPPGCSDLEAVGKSAYQKVVRSYIPGTEEALSCTGCSGMGRFLRDFRNGLGARLKSVFEIDQHALDALKRFLGECRYPARRIVLYYTGTGGQTDILAF